jgi:hypothetical protein
MWFGQTWPQYRKLLFEVNNDTHSAEQANYRKSKGMISGVSDLILCLPNCGKMVGIELKAPESVHKVEHLKNQIDWGRNIVENGGFYIMSSLLIDIQAFIHDLIYDINSSRLVRPDIDFTKKTYKFPL